MHIPPPDPSPDPPVCSMTRNRCRTALPVRLADGLLAHSLCRLVTQGKVKLELGIRAVAGLSLESSGLVAQGGM